MKSLLIILCSLLAFVSALIFVLVLLALEAAWLVLVEVLTTQGTP